jgi:hypothetical protein
MSFLTPHWSLALAMPLLAGLVAFLWHVDRPPSTSDTQSSFLRKKPRKPKAPPRRRAVQQRLPDAILVDVNNVRGATAFDKTVEQMCCCLYRWTMASTSEQTYVVLNVDHGHSMEAFLVGGRVVVSFAGPKEGATADDVIEVGTLYCTRHAQERVLVASSDVLLRLRCTLATQEVGHATASHKSPLLAFEHRSAFANLQLGISVADAVSAIMVGSSLPSAKAAARANLARRERAGKKSELTFMRREQAAQLHSRLRLAAEAEDDLVILPGANLANSIAQSSASHVGSRHEGALAHAQWLNAAENVATAREELGQRLAQYWDRKSEGAFSK